MKRVRCLTYFAHIAWLAIATIGFSTVNAQNYTESQNVTLVGSDPNELSLVNVATSEQFPHRIVGGRPASIQLAPWQVAIINNRALSCGGSIISRNWVLTAAHCTTGELNNLYVRGGTRNFKSGGETRRVDLVVRHGNYNARSSANDIAMLRVTPPFTFSSSLRPVRLPSRNARLPLAYYVTGWGSTSETSALVRRGLRVATVALVSKRACLRMYRGRAIVPLLDLCASARGRDSCSGDSGGALVNGGVQYGIVSFGIGCARRNSPGVYVDVRYYRRWIAQVAQRFAP